MEIIIVGGGVSGLASAIALAKSGHSIRVLEQSANIEELGAGLQLGPNGVRALERLGAWAELERKTFAPPSLRIMDALTGEAIRSFSFEGFSTRFGAPYLVAHRRDLLHALLTTARSVAGIEILTAHEVKSLAWNQQKPILTLRGGKKFSAAAVIGADGLRSSIRRCLLADGPPMSHDQLIYRALIPRITAPALSSDVVLWLYPGGHVVHYPVSGGHDINIVAVIECSRASEARSSDPAPADVAAAFDAMCPDLRYVLGLPRNWGTWAAADRPPVKTWGTGAATLLGDAAHPMLPSLAQGAVAALEDAVTLGDCVASEPDFPAAFRKYETIRRPHTSRLQKKARTQLALYHWRGWRGRLRNCFLKFVPESYFFSRIAWIYVWDHHPVP
jgi:2-polyprenyl-6-methoxyphenol hydroxylase-like FAD-dependent oxidoreductase